MDRANRFAPAYCGATGAALLALLLPLRWPSTACPLGILAFLAATTCVLIGIFIAQPAGRIRHPEFRPEKMENMAPLNLPDGSPP